MWSCGQKHKLLVKFIEHCFYGIFDHYVRLKKVPNTSVVYLGVKVCYIFRKQGIHGFQIWHPNFKKKYPFCWGRCPRCLLKSTLYLNLSFHWGWPVQQIFGHCRLSTTHQPQSCWNILSAGSEVYWRLVNRADLPPACSCSENDWLPLPPPLFLTDWLILYIQE